MVRILGVVFGLEKAHNGVWEFYNSHEDHHVIQMGVTTEDRVLDDETYRATSFIVGKWCFTGCYRRPWQGKTK